MKKIGLLFILISSFTIPLFAQQMPVMPVDPDTKAIRYQATVSEDGTPDVLYDRGASWISNYYKSPTSVLRVQDKANSKIEGTGRLMIYYTDEQGLKRDGGVIMYDIKMEFKPGKYRYTLTNFNLKAVSRAPLEKWLNKKDPAYNPKWDVYLYQVDTTMQGLVKSMKEGMKPKQIKKDEW